VDVLAQGLRVGAGAGQRAEIHVVRLWFCDALISVFELLGSGVLEESGVHIVGLCPKSALLDTHPFSFGMQCSKAPDDILERFLIARSVSAHGLRQQPYAILLVISSEY
jgi:hypothetical protein